MALDNINLAVEPLPSGEPDPTVEEILQLVRSFNLQPINEERTHDEILGYGPNGF
jgi:hypothetical protein